MRPFQDRTEAGRQLAVVVADLQLARPLVLGLPRGGVEVAAEVARALDGDLDVCVVRKVGAPANPEFALGAVGEGGPAVVHGSTVDALGLTSDMVDALVSDAQEAVRNRVARYRGSRPGIDPAGRDVVVVDDGVATGATAEAAAAVLRVQGAARLVLAVPVGPSDRIRALAQLYDEVVCLSTPQPFTAVGAWYVQFGQVPDDRVLELLSEHQGHGPPDAA